MPRCALLLLALSAAAPAGGALIRVSPRGPVKSVRDGMKRARAGDVVELMTGRYNEGQIVISHGGRKGSSAGAGRARTLCRFSG